MRSRGKAWKATRVPRALWPRRATRLPPSERCATGWRPSCAWSRRPMARPCSSAIPWAAASPPKPSCAIPICRWPGWFWKARGWGRPTKQPGPPWLSATALGPNVCAKRALRPSWTGGRRCPCSPASRRCRQRRTPPFALSVSPGTRGLSLAPWKPGAPTIKLLKRLRTLDEKYSAVAARVRAAGLPAMLVPDAGHNVHLEVFTFSCRR